MSTNFNLYCTEREKAGKSAHAILVPKCVLCNSEKSCLPKFIQSQNTEILDSLMAGKRRIARNTCLYSEHDKFNMLYVVRFGQFKVLDRDPAGILRVVKFYMPGDIIGMDAIAKGIHSARVMALESSEVCEISYFHIKKAMASHPQFNEDFIKEMSNALRDRYERSSLLSLSTLDERFASFLLDLSDKYARQGYSNRTFRLSMSRSDIGSYIGATVESVSRLIARFNNLYGVTISGRLVELRNRHQLMAILQGEAAFSDMPG